MRKTIGAALAAATVLATAAPGTAAGEWFWTRTYTDPAGDATAGADVRTVVVDTAGLGWRVRSGVAGLGSAGTYRAYFAGPNLRHVAVVRKAPGSAPRAVIKVSRRQADGTWSSWQGTSCAVSAAWDAAADRVTVTTPRPRCSAEHGPHAVSLQEDGGSLDHVVTTDPVVSAISYPDARGEVGRTADVLSAKVTRSAGAVWTLTRVADLADSGSQTFDLAAGEDGFAVRVVKRAGQPAAASLWRNGAQVPCAMKVNWDPVSNHLSMQTPLRCHAGLADTWDNGLSFRRGQAVDHVAMFD